MIGWDRVKHDNSAPMKTMTTTKLEQQNQHGFIIKPYNLLDLKLAVAHKFLAWPACSNIVTTLSFFSRFLTLFWALLSYEREKRETYVESMLWSWNQIFSKLFSPKINSTQHNFARLNQQQASSKKRKTSKEDIQKLWELCKERERLKEMMKGALTEQNIARKISSSDCCLFESTCLH